MDAEDLYLEMFDKISKVLKNSPQDEELRIAISLETYYGLLTNLYDHLDLKGIVPDEEFNRIGKVLNELLPK